MAKFAKRERSQAAIKMAMYGPPGSGKTFTALLLAEGLAQQCGKRVAAVDTENGMIFYERAVKERSAHPEPFDIDTLITRSISEVLSACQGLDFREHGVILLDSVTHVWESCRLGYEGKTNRAGQIPIWAWAKIKKPWKELMTFLLNCPAHVILCGREADEYDTAKDDGEASIIGKKMAAEKETQYEPHLCLKMEPRKPAAKTKAKGEMPVVAIVEKDRTGILSGKRIEWPRFDNVIAPMMGLLGSRHDVVSEESLTAAVDADAFCTDEGDKLRVVFLGRIKKAAGIVELDSIANELRAARHEFSKADYAMIASEGAKRKQQFEQEVQRENDEIFGGPAE